MAVTDDAAAASPTLSAETGCVFAKALLAGQADCECARRGALGERLVIDCLSPPARTNCATLFELLHERGRFALKLPPRGRPMTHLQALRLQCGGLTAMRQMLAGEWAAANGAAACGDVHRLLLAARQAHASLSDLPWTELVARVAAWQPLRRHRPRSAP